MKVLLILTTIGLCSSAALAQISDDRRSYIVQPNESISQIAINLGDINFTDAIYKANADIITDPNIVSPGQVLSLPQSVVSSASFVYKDKKKSSAGDVNKLSDQQSDQLTQFREMFNQVINQKEASQIAEPTENTEPELELDGFILDETRSKMGRDFYDLFYQNWVTPENAPNFTITITEQPSMGRGTQIAITMDYEQVYNIRLQPRYEYIEAVSKDAVAYCLNIIEQRASIQNELNGL